MPRGIPNKPKTQPAPASTSRGEVASNAPTSDDSLIPPHASTQQAEPVEESAQVQRLRAFLEESFPTEVGRTNRQHPEQPVDTAIRLLQGLHAHTPPEQVERCPEQFCNKSVLHKDPHGWVHFG